MFVVCKPVNGKLSVLQLKYLNVCLHTSIARFCFAYSLHLPELYDLVSKLWLHKCLTAP